jgi:glycerol uptake facilitator-like aquaporin
MTDSIRKLFSEWLGTALLLSVVIGSGIMAERLSGGNDAVALIGNTIATVWGLWILIKVFGPVSGAHFNPVVSMVMAFRGELALKLLVPYVTVQLFGAVCGAWLTHFMFELPILQWSLKARSGAGQWMGEMVATAGLLLVILRAPAGGAASLVASYIGSAYWFTSSTSFANPAAAFGRMFSNTFAGIAPDCVPAFMASEMVGAVVGVAVHLALGGNKGAGEKD